MQTLVKQPSESRLYNFDFSPLMESGETISAVGLFSSAPTGLTVGSPAISGQEVQCRLSGGTDKVTYKLTVRVTTSNGNTLELEGNLRVSDL